MISEHVTSTARQHITYSNFIGRNHIWLYAMKYLYCFWSHSGTEMTYCISANMKKTTVHHLSIYVLVFEEK
jgi:hypothetical protein